MQISVDNSDRPRHTLSNMVQANLLKMANGKVADSRDARRKESSPRRSVRDRLGPSTNGGAGERSGREEERTKLGSIPAELQAWARTAALKPTRARRGSAGSAGSAGSGRSSPARRRRSRSPVDRVRRRSRSKERGGRREKRGRREPEPRDSGVSSVKRGRNHRLDKDRGLHSDSN